MKHLLLLLMIPLTFSGGAGNPNFNGTKEFKTLVKKEKKVKVKIQTNYLLEALIQVESKGIENAVGDKHLSRPSVGVLQIRPIMVREVNRILKKQNIKIKYTLDDRYSKDKSIEMFMIWKMNHHPNDNDEVTARCWNGGPKGWKRNSTLHYWNKVKKEINNLKTQKLVNNE